MMMMTMTMARPLTTLMTLMTMMSLMTVSGYPQGPPLEVCESMFPTGHGSNSHTDTPPYTLTATINGGGNTIAAGSTVTLDLVATGNATFPYYEGIFVQARKTDCNDSRPIGTFSIPPNDDFLQLMNCNGSSNSAVAHKKSVHMTNTTFTWTAPEYQGPIYFRATVVKNEHNFWTNVFSGYLIYSNDTSPASSARCAVDTTSPAPRPSALLPALLLALAAALLAPCL